MHDNGRMSRGMFKARGVRVRIRGRDNAALSMSDFKQGLFELARRLEPYADYRIKSASLYLTVIDHRSDEVSLDKRGQWSIFPYDCAADRVDQNQ
jgi:hypothetical protein